MHPLLATYPFSSFLKYPCLPYFVSPLLVFMSTRFTVLPFASLRRAHLTALSFTLPPFVSLCLCFIRFRSLRLTLSHFHSLYSTWMPSNTFSCTWPIDGDRWHPTLMLLVLHRQCVLSAINIPILSPCSSLLVCPLHVCLLLRRVLRRLDRNHVHHERHGPLLSLAMSLRTCRADLISGSYLRTMSMRSSMRLNAMRA